MIDQLKIAVMRMALIATIEERNGKVSDPSSIEDHYKEMMKLMGAHDEVPKEEAVEQLKPGDKVKITDKGSVTPMLDEYKDSFPDDIGTFQELIVEEGSDFYEVIGDDGSLYSFTREELTKIS